MKYFLFIFLFIGICFKTIAQTLKAPTEQKSEKFGSFIANASLFTTDYAFQFPLADLQNRFGYNSNIGGSYLYKTNKNFLIGLEGHFIFGNQIKEDSLLINLINSNGGIFGDNGYNANLIIAERGYTLGAKIGYIMPLTANNKNSGLLLTLSGGYMLHKIKLNDKHNSVAQLKNEYLKGYDRLCAGYYTSQFIGYINLDNKKLINFYAGIELTEALTKSQRSYYFDVKRSENATRLDMLIGIRLGWILPLYGKSSKKERYFIN